MRLHLRCLAALLFLGTAAPSVFAQITVNRKSVTLDPASTNDPAANLTVRNGGASAVQLSVQLEDWDVDAQGASHWRKPGAVTGSCGRRVSLSPAVMQLAPGEQRVVRVSLSASAQFDAECWSAAVIRSTSLEPGKTRSDTAAIHATVPLYVTPSGLSVDGELSDMYVTGDSLEVIFRNIGKVRTNIVGEIQVQTIGDSVVATVPLDSVTVLVGATRRFRVAMPKLPPGQYLLVALVDYGGEQLTAVQAALEIR